MIQIFFLIIVTSLLVLGLTIATQKGMILFFIRKWASSKVDEENEKPSIYHAIILCPWCMPSIYSAVGYVFLIAAGVISATDLHLWVLYPVVVSGASIISGMVWTIHETISSYKDYVDNKETLTHFDIIDRKTRHQSQQKNNYQPRKSFNHEG